MPTRQLRHVAAWCCVIASAAAIVLALLSGLGRVDSDDRNHDGRPDTWRFYNARARLRHLAIDRNFDGRSDVREYYDGRGVLLRRESDRDFDDRVDLIEEFDPSTRERSRSVVDVDHDGIADLLVLFRSGAPEFSKWLNHRSPGGASLPVAPRRAGLERAATDHVAPLVGPPQSDLAIRAIQVSVESDEWAGLSTSGGLPNALHAGTGPDVSSSTLPTSGPPQASSALILPFSPRAPPLTLI
jgi:hypothetical protein